MNKKSVLFVVLSVFMAVSMFAASYTVKAVTGKVTYEEKPGSWKNVAVGQEVSASTVLNTSLNSSIILELDGKEVTIKAMQKGTVDSLTSSGVASAKGIKKNSLKAASVGDEVTTSHAATATASSRASEAKADVEWDE